VVIFLANPSSPQDLQCPAAPIPDIVVILTVISPAWTADRLIPRAKKTPNNKTKTRRDGDMGASMAMKASAYKHPHGAVTFRRAVAYCRGRYSFRRERQGGKGLRGVTIPPSGNRHDFAGAM
jgi:hypothetical protein